MPGVVEAGVEPRHLESYVRHANHYSTELLVSWSLVCIGRILSAKFDEATKTKVVEEGRLLVFNGRKHGIVCADFFSASEATVACRTLGHEKS